MGKNISLALLSLVVLAGCARFRQPTAPAVAPQASPEALTTPQATAASSPSPVPRPAVVLPIGGYRERRTVKVYGQYVQDRFRGYHIGDDVEYADVAGDVPVLAIAGGEIVMAKRVSGYGGVLVIRHDVNGKTIWALYGHLDLSNTPAVGSAVRQGQQIAVLGDHESAETDGERKHLHFHLWTEGEVKTAGYVPTPAGLDGFLNPEIFFSRQGEPTTPPERQVTYDRATAPHPTFAGVSFTLPEGWAVEYVPQIQALNLFHVNGAGTARERSQIFIRTFTADQFLTLNTVTIHQTKDGQINDYKIRRYDIEKKPGVPVFPHQPAWRSQRHIVTDFRATPPPGRSVFYVVAQNPRLDDATYASFLQSLRLNQ